MLAWASPVAGSYKVSVLAKDTKTALTGQGLITLSLGSYGASAASLVMVWPALVRFVSNVAN